MRYLILLLSLLFISPALSAQDRSNPFEITSRLPKEGGQLAPGKQYSPFDIRPTGTNAAQQPSFAPAAAAKTTSGPIIIQSTDPDEGKASLLAINLILLLLSACLWVLYGDLIRQCLRATVNSGLMNQIYSRRSGGELTALWLGYLFFNVAMGFYFYLLAIHHDISLGENIWWSWLIYTLFVSGLTGLKHWLLWVYARLFPVRKEVSFYAFILMVFSILIGLFLVPICLLVSYAEPQYQASFLYGGLIVIVLLYGFHLIRGGVIAKRYLFSRPIHIMLYLCAIEIAPLLLIYSYLNDSIT